MRKAIAFSSRRLARAKARSSQTCSVGRELRQIIRGGSRPVIVVVSHSPKYIVMSVMGAVKYAIWRNFMITIILDLLIELRMSVIILIIEGVDLDRGFTQGLMYTMER